jgi:hypothetical protein
MEETRDRSKKVLKARKGMVRLCSKATACKIIIHQFKFDCHLQIFNYKQGFKEKGYAFKSLGE